MVNFIEKHWFSVLTAFFLLRLIGLGATIGDAIALIALVSYYLYNTHVSKQKLTDSQLMNEKLNLFMSEYNEKLDTFTKEQQDKLTQINSSVLSLRLEKGLKKVENEQTGTKRYF